MIEKILVTGAYGQLGSEIFFLSKEYSHFNFVFTDVDSLDICDLNKLYEFVSDADFDCIINCAAYTNVDQAENEPELAEQINSIAVKNLVSVAKKYELKLIHVSTDYVFDGKAHSPLSETDMVDPIGVYGTTKLKGENFVVDSNITYAIIRTSWLYSSFGNNFVKTIKKLSEERDELSVISDQVGTPSYARDLANTILKIIPDLNANKKGIYHYSNDGITSWFGFAKQIVSNLDLNCNILPIETKDYKTLAERPCYSVLNKTKIKEAFGIVIPCWKESLASCIRELN